MRSPSTCFRSPSTSIITTCANASTRYWPLPPSPIDTAVYIAAAWLVLGIGALLWINRRMPDRVERIGSILGEEGGELVEALDAP